MRLTDVGLCTFLHTYQRSSTSGLLIRTFDAADWSHGNQFIVGEVQDCNPGVQIVGNSNGNCFSMVIEGIADELIKLETLMIGGDEYIPLFNRFTKCWVEGVTPNCELIDMVTGAGGAKRPRSTIFHNNIFSSAADFKLNILGDYGRFTDNIIKGATAIPTCTITTGGVEGANAVTGTTVPVPAEIVLVWTNLMANTRWENNQGFTSKNENYGTGSIENGHSADIITHGLSYTPDPAEVTINGREDPTNSIGTVWVDNCTDTTFQVNCENDPGASNWDFVWSVRRIYL